jgi:oligopeptide/dipeptide ABC transporter ATP-binding protein
MADRVLVMYAGRPAEAGPVGAITGDPRHPYTRGLIGSVMDAAARPRRLTQISGEVPDVMRLPPGCSFRPRCAAAHGRCIEDPPIVAPASGRSVRCWLEVPHG